MTESQKNDRRVTKPRLVAALLAELDASWAMVIAESPTTGGIFHDTLQCDFKIPFENSEVIFNAEGDASETFNCVCCYGGQRISFEMVRVSGNRWKLPLNAVMSDLRHDPRIAFADKMYSAEIISRNGVVYGYAVDINRDYLAIEVDAAHDLKDADSVKVLIRMINTNCDVFYNTCSVAQVKEALKGSARIILRFEQSGSGKSEERRHERRLVESASIQVHGSAFADGNTTTDLKIQNISSGGMTVALRKGADPALMMAGLILKSVAPDFSFIVAWTRGESMGIRPLLADPQHLGRWYEYVDRTAPPDDRMTSVTRKELADLLTHSGLLKGERRAPLGREAHAHLIASAAGESPLLIQRCILPDGSGHAGLHVSSKRIAESTWFFGEGAALTEKFGDYNAMLDACTNRMVWMSRQSALFCRYLTGIWHYTVKSTASWGEVIAKTSSSVLMDSYQASIEFCRKKVAEVPERSSVTELNRLSAAERRRISLQFCAALYEAFVGIDGTHPLLNAELGKSGPYHRAETRIIEVNPKATLVAHRVFTHNVWSSTGVTNSVFVLVPQTLGPDELQQALAALAGSDICHGTDDYLLVFDGPVGTCERFTQSLPKPKRFTFLVHDLLLNNTLLFQDDKDSRSLRRGLTAVIEKSSK